MAAHPESAATAAFHAPAHGMARGAFAEALTQALKHYSRPDRLTRNPLLAAALLRAEVEDDADTLLRVQALRRLIARHVGQLALVPRNGVYRRVLDATYLCPAVDQKTAAQGLGLAYSSYRRYLADARRLLLTTMWLAELEGQSTIEQKKGQ